MLEGLRFVWNLRVLRTLGLIDLVVTALYLPMESVLFPKYFTDRHQPAQLGWTLMALGVGGVAGALGYAVLSKHTRRRTAVLVATLTFGAATVGIAFLPPLPVILVLCGGDRPGVRADPADLQLRDADPGAARLRGRVVGVMTGLMYAAGPLGLLVAGPLADAAGLTVTFLALAVPILVVGLVACGCRRCVSWTARRSMSSTPGGHMLCRHAMARRGSLGDTVTSLEDVAIERGAALIAELPDGMVGHRPGGDRGLSAETAPSTRRPASRWRWCGRDAPKRCRPCCAGRRANKVPVVTRGAGSGLSGGATALDNGIVLSTEKMRDITVDPVTRTAVCQPGLFNAEVKKAAAEHGLWYPPDPSSFEICSIGGNIATNAGGLCCVKYGVTTDYVLGMQVVLADGTAVRLGGPRLKDVAGLSLTKLFVGSEGTLGVVTEVTLRLLPAQQGVERCGGSFGSVEAAVDAVLGVAARLRPSMLEFMDSVAINAVEDTLRMGLDRSAAAMLVAGSDERGPGGCRRRRIDGRGVRGKRCDRSVFDRRPRRGRGVRRGPPVLHSGGGGQGFAAAGRRRGAAAGARGTGHRDRGDCRRAGPDDLGDRARRRRQHSPADRV